MPTVTITTPTRQLRELHKIMCAHCHRRQGAGLKVYLCDGCKTARYLIADLCLDAILEARGASPEEVL